MINNESSSFILGVIFALLSSAIIFIGRLTIFKVMSLFINKFLNTDINIDGEWIGKITEFNSIINSYDFNNYEERITIHRIGKSVKGKIVIINGNFPKKTYSFEGEFRNSILTAMYRADDIRDFERGCYTLKIEGTGNIFNGYVTYCNNKSEIEVVKYNLQSLSI